MEGEMNDHRECRKPHECCDCHVPCIHEVAGPSYLAAVKAETSIISSSGDDEVVDVDETTILGDLSIVEVGSPDQDDES